MNILLALIRFLDNFADLNYVNLIQDIVEDIRNQGMFSIIHIIFKLISSIQSFSYETVLLFCGPLP